jgi:hypothetical protein
LVSVILTHNFDFYRTVQDRVMSGGSRYNNSYVALKETDRISLVKPSYKYISNPFKNWKNELTNKTKLIASISFARNIAELVGEDVNFNKLTSILHVKEDSRSIKVKDLENIFREIFKDLNGLTLDNHQKIVFDLIFEVAEEICRSLADVGLNLENKVALSIAIRLTAEKFIIEKIQNPAYVLSIKSNQTGMLLSKYKEVFPEDYRSIEVLEKVNLITPENIHLNSFMYEPIIDISDHHLKDLYSEIKQLQDIELIPEYKVAAGDDNGSPPVEEEQ